METLLEPRRAAAPPSAASHTPTDAGTDGADPSLVGGSDRTCVVAMPRTMMAARPGVVAAAALALLLPVAFIVSPSHATATAPDFLIVGGGTAGCTLAARLCAALPAARFVLLERGAARNATQEFTVRSPRQAVAAWATPALTTGWASAPVPGLGHRPVALLTGGTLGGSSAINGGQWTEPLAGDVARWGVAGLDAAAVRRATASAVRALRVAAPPAGLRHKYLGDWLRAARRAGLRTVVDGAGEQVAEGAWLNRLAVTRSGRRVDACTAYVAPALRGACAGRLTVRTGVTVTAVRLAAPARTGTDGDSAKENDDDDVDDGSGGGGGGRRRRLRAVGVDVVSTAAGPAGRPRTLRVRRAVLLAAGPYGTPQLLLLSGVGRPAALRAVGVAPTLNLPVGEGVVLRPLMTLDGTYTGVPLAPVNNASLLSSATARDRWTGGRGGVLGAAVTTALGRVAAGRGAYLIASFASLRGPPGDRAYTSVCLINPASTGTLSLADGSAFTPPSVQPNLFSHDADVATAVACTRRLRGVLGAFARRFRMVEAPPPGGRGGAIDEARVRATASSGLHFVGGAAVGRVLDARLRVRGTDNLYVVDAAAIPSMPRSAGPMASVYVLAEHAAGAIARRYGGRVARP